jgi:hypothetical protein
VSIGATVPDRPADGPGAVDRRPGDAVDYRPGDAVLIRAIGAGRAELRALERQLGAPASDASGGGPPAAPDITIRFVDRLPASGPVRLLGLDDAAFTDTDFLLLRSRFKSRARVAIPLDRAGSALEVTCERGLRTVPLLVPLVNLAALARGIVAVHGSVVSYGDTGILVVGWSKGGKTESVLGLMARGAEFVGDEWVYVHPDGRAVGLAEPCRVWDWQIAQLPWLAARVGRGARVRLRATAALAGAIRGLRSVPLIGRTALGGVLDRGEPVVRRQLSVQVPPARLFPGRLRHDTTVDAIVLAVSSEDPAISADPVAAAEVIRRMVRSNEHERLDLAAAALKFGFAFPDRPAAGLDGVSGREGVALTTALGNRPAWLVRHPYPPRIDDLAQAILAALPTPRA